VLVSICLICWIHFATNSTSSSRLSAAATRFDENVETLWFIYFK